MPYHNLNQGKNAFKSRYTKSLTDTSTNQVKFTTKAVRRAWAIYVLRATFCSWRSLFSCIFLFSQFLCFLPSTFIDSLIVYFHRIYWKISINETVYSLRIRYYPSFLYAYCDIICILKLYQMLYAHLWLIKFSFGHVSVIKDIWFMRKVLTISHS